MGGGEPGDSPREITTEELMAAFGYVITEEGKARARRRLAEARAEWTPERRAEFWAQLEAQARRDDTA